MSRLIFYQTLGIAGHSKRTTFMTLASNCDLLIKMMNSDNISPILVLFWNQRLSDLSTATACVGARFVTKSVNLNCSREARFRFLPTANCHRSNIAKIVLRTCYT